MSTIFLWHISFLRTETTASTPPFYTMISLIYSSSAAKLPNASTTLTKVLLYSEHSVANKPSMALF
jgi:hypothetical protein